MDLTGPTRTESLGKRYFMVMLDDFSNTHGYHS